MPNKKSRNKHAPKIDHDFPTPTARITSKKRKRSTEDDTPKEFTRLLSRIQNKSKPIGLDDPPATAKSNKQPKKTTELKIQPRETLRQFNRRVDASLPINLKPEHLTKAQRAKKKKAKTKSAAEKTEDDDNTDDREEGGGGRRKRGKNKGRGTSPDPWAPLAAKRQVVKFSDVAKAPPTLVEPRSVLHTSGLVDVEGVPKSAGSLARREGLAGERKGIVEGYRKMIEERRGKGTGDRCDRQ